MHKIIFFPENQKKNLCFTSKFRWGRATLNTGIFFYLNCLYNSFTCSITIFRVQTVLRAIKQMQASVKRVHRSIEDKLLSSQEKARKVRNAKKVRVFFVFFY